MPAARRGQTVTCFLVELGTGDKFLFNIGTGSMGNIMSLDIPNIHAEDAPVSFILEWNGYKSIYGGDTEPNKWFMEYGKDADLIVYKSLATIVDAVSSAFPTCKKYDTVSEYHQ